MALASEMRLEDPILIVGAGVGGLTAALALARRGLPIRVFERAASAGDLGAGISLGRTASRALYALGLHDVLEAASDKPQRSAALDWRTGEVLGGAFAARDWSKDDLADTHMIHRADLFEILRSALEAAAPGALRMGRALEGFEADDAGVVATFAGGERVRGSAMIGCDGLRSTVRRQLLGDEAPLFTGRVAYRFLVPIEQARPFMSAGPSSIYVGPRQSMLRYLIRKGTLVNCVTFAHSDAWTEEGWSQRVERDELTSLFEGWHPDVVGLARRAPSDGTAKWALYDRDPLQTWAKGRVALLGDAAHPLLPFLGFGAALAVEDAVILARAFTATSDPAGALQVYEGARRDRAADVMWDSRLQGRIYDDGADDHPQPRMSHRTRLEYDATAAPLPAPVEASC
jgi:salicylate hydroxylase